MPKGKTKTSPKKPQSLNHFSKKKTISLICGITTGVLFAGGVGGVVGWVIKPSKDTTPYITTPSNTVLHRVDGQVGHITLSTKHGDTSITPAYTCDSDLVTIHEKVVTLNPLAAPQSQTEVTIKTIVNGKDVTETTITVEPDSVTINTYSLDAPINLLDINDSQGILISKTLNGEPDTTMTLSIGGDSDATNFVAFDSNNPNLLKWKDDSTRPTYSQRLSVLITGQIMENGQPKDVAYCPITLGWTTPEPVYVYNSHWDTTSNGYLKMGDPDHLTAQIITTFNGTVVTEGLSYQWTTGSDPHVDLNTTTGVVGIYGGASTDASYFITVKIDNVEVDTIEISVLKSDTDVPKYINPQVSGFLQSQSTNTLHLLVQGNFNCAANIANIVVTPSGANASYIAVAAETPQTGDTVAKFDISLNNQTNNSEGNFTITVTDPTDGVQPWTSDFYIAASDATKTFDVKTNQQDMVYGTNDTVSVTYHCANWTPSGYSLPTGLLDNDNFTLADGVITRKNQNLPAKDYTLRFQASDNQDTITDDIVVSVIPQVVKSFHIVCDNSEMHYGHSEDTVSVSYKYANWTPNKFDLTTNPNFTMTNNVISRIGNVQPGTYSIEISATDDTTTLTDTLPIYVESVGDPTFTVKTENPNLWVGDGTSITCEYAYHNWEYETTPTVALNTTGPDNALFTLNDNVLSRKDPQLGQGIYHVQFTCTGTNMAGDPIVLTDSLTVIISPQNNLALMFSTEDTYQLTGSNRPIYASLASANYDVLPNTNSLVVVVNGVPSSNFSINFTNNGPGITINDIIPITTEQTINIQILDTVNNITSNGITINYVHKVPVADNSWRYVDIYGEAVINGGRLNMNDLNFIGVSTPIVSLSMGTMKNLLYIHIENQQLEELDVSSCPALNSLTANNNHLTSVDFSNNLNMNNADLSYNQLTTIDFSMTNPTSTGFSLEATDNKLTSLYLPNDDGTTYDYNTSITISNNPNLTDIYTKKMKAKINFLKNTDGQVLKPSYTIHTKPGSTTVGSGTVDGTTPISFTYDRTWLPTSTNFIQTQNLIDFWKSIK